MTLTHHINRHTAYPGARAVLAASEDVAAHSARSVSPTFPGRAAFPEIPKPRRALMAIGRTGEGSKDPHDPDTTDAGASRGQIDDCGFVGQLEALTSRDGKCEWPLAGVRCPAPSVPEIHGSSTRTMDCRHGESPNSTAWRQSRALPAGNNQLKPRTSSTVAGLPSFAGMIVPGEGEGNLALGAQLGAPVISTLTRPP